MDRSTRLRSAKESGTGLSLGGLSTAAVSALGIYLLGWELDHKAEADTVAPLTTTRAEGQFYAKNNTSPATVWLPTGPGDPEDFLCRSAAERTSIVKQLKGGNTLYVMAVKTHGGDGPKNCNPWIGGNPAEGLDRAKLDDWFNALQEADRKGVVIHFFIYDDSSCPWGVRSDCKARTTLEADEREFVDALVDRFKPLANLVWVVAEEYPEAVRPQRAAAIAAHIRSRDAVHPIGIHQLSKDTSFHFPNDNNFDVFLLQLGSKVRSSEAIHDFVQREYTAARGRYAVVLAEVYPWHTELIDAGDRANLRRSIWAAVMGGAAGVLVLGTWATTPPTKAMVGDMYRVHALLKGTDATELANAASAKTGTTHYVRKNSDDTKMLVYSRSCTKKPYPGVIRLLSGTYRATWMNPKNGTRVTQTIVSDGGAHNFGVPPTGMGAECVIWVRP
jgi:hypothetical protein